MLSPRQRAQLSSLSPWVRSEPGRAACALPGTEGEGPGSPCFSPCWDGMGWDGRCPWLQGTGSLLKPEMQVLMLVLAPWSGMSPLSLCRIHLGCSVERNLAFPCTEAHPEQCFQVKKILFVAAKKTYKCDQKGPSASATRNENKGWCKIPCF